MTTPAQPTPAASAIARADGDLIALNAAALRLFKGQYRDSGDRHSDALFVLEGLVLLQERLAPLDAARAAAEEECAKLLGFYNEIVAEIGHDRILNEYRQRGRMLSEETSWRKESEKEVTALRARLLAVESERDEARSSASELSESFAFLGLDPAGIKTQLLVEVDRRQKAESANATNCGSLQRHMKWNDELKLALTAAEARCAALEADKPRLDWLEDVSKIYHIEIRSQPSAETVFNGQGKGLRAAIDAARQPDAQGPKPRAPDENEKFAAEGPGPEGAS